jgi:hypothetical protein
LKICPYFVYFGGGSLRETGINSLNIW